MSNDVNDMEKDAEKDVQEEKQEDQTSVFGEIIHMLIYIAFVLFASFLIITFVAQRTEVSGSSMNPILSDGDNLIVDKISYRFNDPERFDIIIFPYQYEEDTYYIKRIIGLPGETVQVINGYVYVNGVLLEEDVYGKEVMNSPGIAAEPITLGDGEYFVLGDNRNDSKDSRNQYVGVVHREDIVGRAFIRIWPLDQFGLLEK